MMMVMILVSSLNSKTIHHVLLLLLTAALLLRTATCGGKSNSNPRCSSSCGNIQNIRHPFWLKGDPKVCGDSRYNLTCENNRTVLFLYNGRYYVSSIYYSTDRFGVITVVDDGLQKDNRFSLPRYSLTFLNFSYNDPYSSYTSAVVSILNCSKPVISPKYVTASNVSRSNNYYLYAVLNANAIDVEDFCTVSLTVLASDNDENYPNSSGHIHNIMMEGFNLSFGQTEKIFVCYSNPGYIPWLHGGCTVSYNEYLTKIQMWILEDRAMGFAFILVHFFAAKFIIGAPFVLAFLIRKWKRRHLAMDANIEEFLQANNNFLPIRYSYSDIKKITKNFKYKLGEGGYGSVYRGKLKSGSEVAIKVLKKSKGNDQDFISEVATVGRIHHVNVVQLIGFCIEGLKQALVYHFMPNGSLDKHIFSKVDGTLLDCKKIYDIALGVARGMEYLHQGCDMQILHFDIKPHNILLDENFTPKISDFGLAKLYPTNRNIVTLTAVRGTLGYMAPEFFYKDLGGVSYKADVYSFGMLLMELAGRRKNFIENPESSSQAYFPQWVYDQLNKGEAVELEEVMEEEREMMKKMIIVAFWCIQLNPSNRPSMKKVINMLKGDIDELQMPPKPLLYPTYPAPVANDSETQIELETFSSSSSASLISVTSQFSCEGAV